jgi:PleD family two-component response regulator
MSVMTSFSTDLGEGSSAKQERKSKRVLVVDDCAVSRSALEIILQRSGWEAVGAADGAEALKLAASWDFDLVITVPEPKEVSGRQLARLLKGGLLPPTGRIILQVERHQAWSLNGFLSLVDDVLVKESEPQKQLPCRLDRWSAGSQAANTAVAP